MSIIERRPLTPGVFVALNVVSYSFSNVFLNKLRLIGVEAENSPKIYRIGNALILYAKILRSIFLFTRCLNGTHACALYRCNLGVNVIGTLRKYHSSPMIRHVRLFECLINSLRLAHSLPSQFRGTATHINWFD